MTDYFDDDGPGGLYRWAERYLNDNEQKGFSPYTISTRQIRLRVFIRWCYAHRIQRIAQVEPETLDDYTLYLRKERRGRHKGEIRPVTLVNHLRPIVLLFKWLVSQSVLMNNPASTLSLNDPKPEVRDVLTDDELKRIFDAPDLTTQIGLRDRAIFETFYSTGIRLKELQALETGDIDESNGIVTVRQGKGGKHRLVPIGERALNWLIRYRTEARAVLCSSLPQQSALFVCRMGKALKPSRVHNIVYETFQSLGIRHRGCCHLFRHTMASTMLKNGADLRIVQEILGHASIETTVIYTHLDIGHLKAVHAQTHPGLST